MIKLLSGLTCIALFTSVSFAQGLEGVVVGDRATVRSGNGFDQSAIGTISIGTTVSILSEMDGWYQVSITEHALNGWIHRDLVAAQKEDGAARTYRARVNATVLNVRSAPGIDAHRITQLSSGQEVVVISTDNEWVQVLLKDGQKGWAHGEFLILIPNQPSGAVNKDEVVFYQMNSGVYTPSGVLELGQVVYIQDYNDSYFSIKTEQGFEGWLNRQDVSLIINGENPVSRGQSRIESSEFISITKKYLGKPYKYASTGPNSFDCSGYVYYILNKYYGDQLKSNGINLPRSSRTMANVGTPVSRNNLEVGDLVFFNNTSGTINHVGLYIGNNQFIHASSGSSMSVIISPLNTGTYNTRYNTARRLF